MKRERRKKGAGQALSFSIKWIVGLNKIFVAYELARFMVSLARLDLARFNSIISCVHILARFANEQA